MGAAQVGVDSIAAGPVAIHDHVRIDFHAPVLNDPFPHEVIQGYAFDGADVGLTFEWHWGNTQLRTQVRATPVARSHFAFDQDTDFEPGTNFTHGNAGTARSRTFAITQQIPLVHWRVGRGSFQLGYSRQFSRYYDVTTYDLNSNPALPSRYYQRTISERAILIELSNALLWTNEVPLGRWRVTNEAAALPLSAILVHNYIPTVLAATTTSAYGFRDLLTLQRSVGRVEFDLGTGAGWWNSYSSVHGFRREVFDVHMLLGELAHPKKHSVP